MAKKPTFVAIEHDGGSQGMEQKTMKIGLYENKSIIIWRQRTWKLEGLRGKVKREVFESRVAIVTRLGSRL